MIRRIALIALAALSSAAPCWGESRDIGLDGIPGWPVHTDPLEVHDAAPAFTSGALPHTVYSAILGGPAVGDLDRDGVAHQTPADNQLAVWDVAGADGTAASGLFRPAFPRVVNDLQFLTAPSVADIDGDGLPEALEGSGVYDLHAINVNGVEPAGWPKLTGGWVVATPAVGDIDGDGRTRRRRRHHPTAIAGAHSTQPRAARPDAGSDWLACAASYDVAT